MIYSNPPANSPEITQEISEKYWVEHKANMTWGVQKALNECLCPREVAIFGAGKCNDIRLLEIMQKGAVQNIDLYDVDLESVESAISYVKGRIEKILPEAVNFVNFNPVITDITFVMKSIFKKFAELKCSLEGSGKEKELFRKILIAIRDSIRARHLPEKKYDVVVSDCILSQILNEIEFHITKLRNEVVRPGYTSDWLWENMNEIVHEIFVTDHFKILDRMTGDRGSIFFASDNILLLRGKIDKTQFQELAVPRFKYMNGNLSEMAKKHMQDFDIVGDRSWEWNRNPHELQNEDSIFCAEKVQGIVLKRK